VMPSQMMFDGLDTSASLRQLLCNSQLHQIKNK
jgi:hypothetical protein